MQKYNILELVFVVLRYSKMRGEGKSCISFISAYILCKNTFSNLYV
jgi:hypothetical protein